MTKGNHIKPAKLNKIISLVEKERESGDVVEEERDTLDTAADLAGSRESKQDGDD
ncbi:hypothetical protein [Acidithiobacillus thiooxidans]|uniref:hypothetical protein n=1 Tax=Acidithiobacillus thiooxidans TaxID=930 RepID=UPI003569D13D|nr:hypothetical protein [Acidithiobacillus sp.]